MPNGDIRCFDRQTRSYIALDQVDCEPYDVPAPTPPRPLPPGFDITELVNFARLIPCTFSWTDRANEGSRLTHGNHNAALWVALLSVAMCLPGITVLSNGAFIIDYGSLGSDILTWLGDLGNFQSEYD